MDPFAKFKEIQRQGWAHFAPLEMVTMPAAARLVAFAGVRPGQQVLDAACGTGVVAVTAARIGADVTGLDLTPELLVRARENASIAGVVITWHEGDVEALPFRDASFDVVLSQFGHMFAPRPDVAVRELLRVLRPGGTIAFSTWPPEMFVGRMFALVGRYMPPPPEGVASPPLWGEVGVIRERLGDAVRDVTFRRDAILPSALSAAHHRTMTERTAGPVLKLVETLSQSDPARLETFRREYEALATEWFADNTVRQDYLMTRAAKV